MNHKYQSKADIFPTLDARAEAEWSRAAGLKVGRNEGQTSNGSANLPSLQAEGYLSNSGSA
jgi:hypothetical protein